MGAACAVDGQSKDQAEGHLLAEARAIHQRVLTFDAHADIEIPGKPSMYVGADGLSKVAVEKMRQGGLGCGRNGCGCRSAAPKRGRLR